MRGVILAAGDGGRFRPYTYRTPKVLIQLRERPLISYPMAAMAKAGISEVGVVVGYQAGRIVEELTEWAPDGMRLEFIYNHEFDGGNAVSVRAARKFTGDSPFMLAMGDHVIEPGVAAMPHARSRAPRGSGHRLGRINGEPAERRHEGVGERRRPPALDREGSAPVERRGHRGFRLPTIRLRRAG